MRVFNTQLLSGLIFSLLITAGSLVLGQTYSSAPGIAIPDNNPAGVSDTITIPPQQTDVITDLNVDLVIDHTWVGDLTVTLTHVATGTVVTLIEAPGAPPTSNSCPGDNIDATMDDAAATAAETTCDTPSVPAIGGSKQPNGLLADFNNETLAGQWVLKVSDNGTGDVGTLVSWTLNFTTVPGIPYNDVCGNAYALECGDVTTGTTVNATIDNLVAPACSTLVEAPGVWYTVEGNGDSITVSLCNPGTNYDTRLNIYTGSCDSLVCVTGDDDACGFAGSSEVTFMSDPCVTYYILVHGFVGATGDFELSVTCNSAPTTLVADAGTDASFCYDGGANSTTLGGAPTGSGGHYLFPYRYSWSPTIGLSDPTVANPTAGGVALVPGVYNYTVTVTDTCGLVATDVVTVTVWENPIADAGPDQAFCYDLLTTTLNGSASNGTSPYSYQWSPSTYLSNANIANPTFSAPSAGTYTYTLTVTDANGCTDQDVMTITVYPEPTVDAGLDTAICEKESVVIGGAPTGTGGTMPYTYSWSPNYQISSTSVANPTVDPRVSTTYTVWLTDANGCTDMDTVRVKVFPETPVSFTGLDPLYCGSDPCAALTGSPAGGTFSGPGISGNSFCPGIAGPGTHTIIYTYTDINGCVNADTQVTVVTPILVVDAGADQTICNNISINLGGSPTASGGTTPYTYSWMPTDYLDDPTASNPLFTPTAIPSYSYTVTVTDANGCVASDVININTLPAPVADAGPDVEKCDECPGVTIGGYPTASDGDGTLDYSYTWSPSTGLNNPSIPNPIASPATTTTYTVVVTDNANGCTDEDMVTVTVNPLPAVSIVGLDPGYCTNGGNVTLSGSPAGGTFYGEGVTGTTTSTEVFKICYEGGNLAIPDNALPLNVILNGQNIQGQNLGTDVWLDSVQITIDHTYVGDLSVTLESPNGTNVVLVDRPGVPASTFGCDGNNISATFVTGTGNSVENECNSYTPTIHGEFTAHSGYDLNSLNDGSDPNGAWTLEITDIISGNTGEFVTATLFFSSQGTAASTAVLDPTVPTTSPVMIYYAYTDANGCKNIDSQLVELFDPPIVAAGADQTICSNETATLGSSPVAVGNGPFTYSWMPTAGLSDASAENPVFTPTAGGTYTFTVTVTDANGCSESDMVTITVNEAPVADAGADDVICADGSVVLGGSPVANGGTSPYTYSWSPALGLSSTTAANPTFTPVGPATYSFTVTVTDANGCTDDDVVEILVNPLPTVDAGADFAICVDATGTLGGATVATGNGPFTYSWMPTTGLSDPTAANPVFDPATDGTYTFTVTVTDANGCVNSDAITVTVNPLPIVDAGMDQSVCKFEGTTIGGSPTATAASGGSSVFGYSWSPATYLNSTTLANPVTSDMRNTTVYTVTVTDGNGCVSSDQVTVTVWPLPVVTFSGFASSYCEDDNTDYVLTGNPAGGTFTSTTPLIQLPYGGTQYTQAYTMTPVAIPAEDPAGITLAQAVSLPGTSLGNDITLDSINIQINHTGVGDLYISITNPNGTTVELLDHPYPYWYDNIDANWVWGTSNPATTSVFPYPAIQGSVNAVNGDDVNSLNDGSNPNGSWNLFIKDDLRSYYSGTITGATLYFSGPSEAFNPSVAGVGTYTIIYTYTDANGCTNADTQTTEVHPIPTVSFTGLQSIYCADADPDTLIGTPAGGVFAGPGVQSQSTGTPATCSYTLDMYDSWGDGWNGGYLEVFVNGVQVAGNNGMQFKAFGTFSSASFLVEDGASIELFYTSGSFESENSFDLKDPNGNIVYSAGPNIPTGKIYSGTSTTSGCGLMYTFSAPLAGPGTHTIYYTYVDGNGCSNVDSQTVTVLTPLVVDAGTDVSICAYPGETVVLGGSPTASGSEGTYTYTWTPATNIDDPTAANPVFTQPGAGDYSYMLTVVDGQGCQASDAINIHVDTVPVVTISGVDTAYCINALPDTLIGTPEGGIFSGPGVVIVGPGGSGGGGGPTCNPATPLSTTYSFNNGQSGNMFDIVAINNVQVQSFDVNIDPGSYTIEVYTKNGTWQGFETNASAWTLVATTSVSSAGSGNPTALNLNLAIPINAGDRQAFYVTVVSSTTMNYTNGTSTGAVYAQDANIQILQGCGKSYPFGSTFQPRIWNGTVHYDLCTPSAPGGNVAPAITVSQCVDPYSNVQDKSIIAGGTWTYTFTNVPTPTADGELNLAAKGDLDWSLEYINIYDENGNYLGFIGKQSPQCGNISDVINLPLADLQNWAADGVMTFTAQATVYVGAFCGGDHLQMELNYCKGAVITQDFNCNTTQFDDSGLPVPVPPTGTGGFGTPPTTRILNVSGINGNIGQTIGADAQLDQVILNISHTWNSDLELYLTAPNGAQILLWSGVGGSSDGFDVTITDNATTSIASAGPGYPITGTYKAQGGLLNSVLAGSPANGNWKLEIYDRFGGDNGTLNDFSLVFQTCTPAKQTVLFWPDSAGVGTHWITYTFTDGNGCTASDSIQITVYPLADLLVEQDTTVCRGEPVTLTATATGTPGPYDYLWMPADGLDTTMGPVVVATPDSTTTYTVFVTDARGCSTFDSVQVVIWQPPVVHLKNVTGGDTVCYNELVCLWADVDGVGEDAPVPELIYYKFDQSGQSSVDNLASSPVGNNPAPIVGSLKQTGTGQFGSALQGVGGSSASNYVNSGWATDLGDGSWTISFWTHKVPWNVAGNLSSPWHVFGDPSAKDFRCEVGSFNAGSPGSMVLRGPFPDVVVPNVSYGPSVVTYVHDSATGEVRGYLDGQRVTTVTYNLVPLQIVGNGPFKVGGYGTLNGLSNGMLVDEFRVYNRALTDQQVLATAFVQLQDSTGLTYIWSNSTSGNDTVCFNATQTEMITVDVIDQNGCVGSDTFNLVVNPEVVVFAGDDRVLCKGESTVLGGTPTASGGQGALTYEWQPFDRLDDPFSANPTADPLINTTYTVFVTDETGCTYFDEVVISVNEVPMANAGGDVEICEGDNVVIGGTPAATGGVGPYTYSWMPVSGLSDPTAANPTASPTVTTAYTLTVTDANGCTDDSLMRVIVRPLPDVTITAAGPLCVNDNAITLSAASTGGTWSGSGITDAAAGTFDPAVAGVGTHTITYTNTTEFGCTASSTVDITVVPLPEPTIAGPNAYCLNQGVVTLTASPAGGTWSGAGIVNSNTGEFDPVAAGLGSHMVIYAYTDTVGCTGYDTAMVSVSEAPEISILPAGPFCQSDDPVNLSATPAGGTWSGAGITDANAGTFDPSVAGVGTHVITYTYVDPIGCTVSADITIVVEGIANLTINQAGPFCQEENTSLMTASVGGGYWSGPGIINPLNGEFSPAVAGAGTHTITYTVTGQDGCVTITTGQVTVNASPNTEIVQVGPFCADEPAVNLQAATPGGTWSGTGIVNSTAGTFDPATAGAGTYTITYEVTDANGCFNTGFTTIKVNELPVASGSVIDVTCSGYSNGKIDVEVEGGAPPYRYDWSNGEVTQDVDEVTAGTYSFTVTDAKGCASTASFTVGVQSGVISATAVVTNATTPIYNNGSIDVTITGGVAPYLYTWSNGAESEDVSNLRPDTYTLVVTDALGCTETFTFTVGADFGLGIDENDLSSRVSLYPNPTSDVININIELSQKKADLNMTVFDMLGRKVYEIHGAVDKAYQHTIDVKDWASGQYMVRFDIEGTLVTKKFVITK